MSGSFFDVYNEPKEKFVKSNFTDYIKLENNVPVKVQLIPKAAEKVYKHWFPTMGKKLPLKCLGNECPLCSRNQAVDYDKDHKDFIARQESTLINVLDLTPSKICPKCSSINPKNAVKCTSDGCDQMLVDVEVQPMNVVRYIDASYTLGKRIEGDIEGNLDNMGVWVKKSDDDHPTIKQVASLPIAIKMFPISEKKSDYNIPFPLEYDKINTEDYLDKAFSAKDVGIELNYNEMMMLIAGSTFKEVMESRKETPANKEKVESLFGE
jgi:hypothetical protein